MRSPREVIVMATLCLAAACAKSAHPSNGPAEPIEVRGTVTNIVVSDHPAGICDPQSEYTDVEISFSPAGTDREIKAHVSPVEIVTTDPCTKVGTFDVELDPGLAYEACVNETTHEPGAIDVVGSGTCGIRVEPPMLEDGRFDITFDDRKTGSKEYSTYS